MLKWDYNSCKDFNILYDALVAGIAGTYPDFSLHDGYLFKGTRLFLPDTSLREQVIWELNSGGAAGHFGIDKMIVMIEHHF